MEQVRDIDDVVPVCNLDSDAKEEPLEREMRKLRQIVEDQFALQLRLLLEIKCSKPRNEAPGPVTRSAHLAPVMGDLSAGTEGSMPLSPVGEFNRTISPGMGSITMSSMASDAVTSNDVVEFGVKVMTDPTEQKEHKKKAYEAQERSIRQLTPVPCGEEDEQVAPRWKDIPGIIVNSTAFPIFIQFVILANLLVLGLEVDTAASVPSQDMPGWFEVANYVIVFVFTAELLLKFMALGCRKYFCSSDRTWNLLDLIIVSVSILECGVDLVAKATSGSAEMNSSHLRAMRLARLARTLRGVRIIRLLRYISSLRTIMISIVSTMGSLFWTLVLLVLVFYTFAVILTQMVSDYCKYDLGAETMASCNYHDIAYWSSVPESMLTLFLSISGGLSWVDALLPLRQIGPLAVGSMLLYVVLTIFAILNVVTGVFCNNAIESAQSDKDIAIMKQMHKHESQVRALGEIFAEIDEDASERITIRELKEALNGDKMSNFLKSMDISTEDVWTLFMVIDSNADGEISADEFVYACQQLQGPAKGLQMARMSFENTVMREEVKKLQKDFVRFKKQIVKGASPSPTSSPPRLGGGPKPQVFKFDVPR